MTENNITYAQVIAELRAEKFFDAAQEIEDRVAAGCTGGEILMSARDEILRFLNSKPTISRQLRSTINRMLIWMSSTGC